MKNIDKQKESNTYRLIGFGLITIVLLYCANYNTIISISGEFNIKDRCTVNELSNPLGANRCTNNNQCEGDRTCSFSKWCTGISNCPISSI